MTYLTSVVLSILAAIVWTVVIVYLLLEEAGKRLAALERQRLA